MSDSIHPEIRDACIGRIGTSVGRWRLTRLVGAGGMAAVYGGEDDQGRTAAIKLLHQELSTNSEIRDRFLREAYIANKIKHPGAVQVLDGGVSPAGEPFIAMELLQGSTVELYAERTHGGRLPPAHAIDIADQMLAVLEVAHALGIVHRDLKPENLFLLPDGTVKLLDFGIARLWEDSNARKTATGMLMGTPAFMAPEQALGQWSKVDARTDLWAVGAVMFSLISGRPVHKGDTANEVMVRAATLPAPSLARVVKVARGLVRVVDKALDFDIERRFASATEMRAALATAAIEVGGGGAVRPNSLRPPAPSSAVPAVSHHPTAAVAPDQLAAAARQSAQASGAPVRGGTLPLTAPDAVAQLGGAAQPGSPSRVPAPAMPAPAMPAPAVPAPAVPAPAMPAPAPAAESYVRAVERGPNPAGGDLAALVSDMVDEAQRERPDASSYDGAHASPEEVADMLEVFSSLEKALVSRAQYGDEHPEVRRRFERLFSVIASALMRTSHGLVWNVTPYAFKAADKLVWEPKKPWDRVPYQLFSDGVRMMGLLPGLSEPEFLRFIAILTMDAMKDFSPEDDMVTLLWDADFEHIVHQAIDNFAEGDAKARIEFERRVMVAMDETRDVRAHDLEKGWSARRTGASGPAYVEQQVHILRILGDEDNPDEQSSVRVELMLVPEDAGAAGAVEIRKKLRPDPRFEQALRGRLQVDTSETGQRFVFTAAQAYREFKADEESLIVARPLRGAVDGLAERSPLITAEMIGALCEEVGSDAEAKIRGDLATEIVTEKTLRRILDGTTRAGSDAGDYVEGLRLILQYLDDAHLKVVLAVIGDVTDEALQELLVSYLQRVGVGHEKEFADLFSSAPEPLGIALVRVLAALGTDAAKNAITRATASPHVMVRIEALGHVEGASGDRLRVEMRKLIEDGEEPVRIAALRAMRTHRLRVAGPFLVLRIQSKAFSRLTLAEQREAMLALAALAPRRAEDVCTELLGRGGLFGSAEEVRMVAAEILGDVAATDESIAALERAADKGWFGSARVASAAALALERARVSGRRAASPTASGVETKGSSAQAPAAPKPQAAAQRAQGTSGRRP